MEKKKKISFLFLLFAVPHVCGNSECPTNNKVFLTELTCYNDYNNTITCQWKSPYMPDHGHPECTIYAENKDMNGSCKLKPVDTSNPMLKECSIVFEDDWRFLSFTELTMDLRCEPLMQNLSFVYKPACNIKLNPPPRPSINFTSVSWNAQVAELRFKNFRSQLQWKREDQLWNDTSVLKRQTIFKECRWDCTAGLDKDLLVEGMRHEARVRVEKVEQDTYMSTWSNWSPTVSWVSPIGRAEPTPSSGVPGGIVSWVSVACGAVVAVAVIFFKTNNTTWIYIVKRIRSSPLPDPGKSFLQDGNFQNWLSPHFTSQPCPSFSKPVEFSSVEISSAVDAVAPSGPEASHLVKSGGPNSCKSTSSSFSNPSYSEVSPPPPVSSLTAGNLEACDADSPYGPVGSQSDGEQDRDEERRKEVEIQQLLSKGSNNSEPVLIISDYEKVEKPQVERSRLQSLDSGVCSEEVSQESFEADSINVNDYHDEGPEGKEDREGKVADFQKMFGGSGGHSDKAPILVCSDYESVRKLQADSPELPSLDSGITSEGEEQVSQEESLEDADKSTESTSLLFSSLHPAPTGTLACSLPLLTTFPLKVSGAGLSPALPSQILEKIALMPNSRSVEPSGDGYMPVRQEQS